MTGVEENYPGKYVLSRVLHVLASYYSQMSLLAV
jgi:hypothetical protein